MTNNIADFTKSLLSQIDIVDIIQARVSLRKAGSNYQAVCPFHTESTPSFSVNPQKQFFYCFGCHASGDAIHFVMRYDNMSFMDALEHLAAKQGLSVPKKNQTEAQRDRTVYKVMRDMALECRKDLQSSAQMMQYLQQRGLTDTTMQKYHLGYCGKNYLNWFDKARVAQSKYLMQGGIASGVAQQVKPKFFKRLMFPIQDSTGKVIGFGGRTTEQNGPKYLNSPETDIFKKRHVLYGLHQFRQTKKHSVFIVEGYMDVLALHSHGLDNAVACLGTAFTGQHWHLIKRYVQEVTFCFDGDRAGKAAAWKSLEAILPGLSPTQQVQFLFLPEGHDPDSYLQEHGKQAFLTLCKSAVSWSDYMFGKLESEHSVATLNGKAALMQAAGELIDRVENTSLQVVLKDRLSTLTSIKEARTTPKQAQHKTANKEKVDKLCEEIVSLLMNKNDQSLANTEPLDQFGHNNTIEHINAWLTTLQSKPETTGDELLSTHQGSDYYAKYAELKTKAVRKFQLETLEAKLLLLRCEIIESLMQRMLSSNILTPEERATIQSLIKTKKDYQRQYRDLQRLLVK